MTNVYNWSTDPANNGTADGALWPEGQLPSTVNNSARDNMAAIAQWRDDTSGKLATSLGPNALTLTLATTTLSALAVGMTFTFQVPTTNTGAVTLSVNGLPAKAVRRDGGIALTGGELVVGGVYRVTYVADDTFRLHNIASAFVAPQYVTKAGDVMTGTLSVRSSVSQYNAGVVSRQSTQGHASFEFGHTNTAGYGSVLGCQNNTGNPYLAFNAGPGTSVINTFRTLGVAGVVLMSDLAGGLIVGQVPNSNADNQALTNLVTVSGTGGISVVGGASIGGALFLGGNLSITKVTPELSLQKTASAGQSALIHGYVSGSPRWSIDLASSAADDFGIRRFDDAGNWTHNPFSITRATNIVNCQVGLNVAGATASTSYQTGALTVAGGVGIAGRLSSGPHHVNGSLGSVPVGGLFPTTLLTYGGTSTSGLATAVTVDSYPNVAICFLNHANTLVGSISMPNASGVAFNASSDIRLKPDLRPFENATPIIDALRVHDHSWRNSEQRDVGLVAQEVHEVFPLAVTPGSEAGPDADGFMPWMMNYSKFIPLLIANAQETHRRIAELERELHELRRKQ